ncbi:TIGR00725 family protein [Balneola sp. MJW-20]|uniref:TIGR00725 family protein n=1 Tax=Gracilimonas aurantiaca TaxID=3234185 RepID=UPI003465EB78
MIISIIGPGESASVSDEEHAYEAGKLAAELGHTVLTGGRASGVMEAALKGAKEGGGTTVGILPGNDTSEASAFVDIPIITGMGQARNQMNILTADAIIAIGIGPGTLSEIALAVKEKKPLILFRPAGDLLSLLNKFEHGQLFAAATITDLSGVIKNKITVPES